MKNAPTEGLVALKSLKKYKVAATDHDIRGWDVVTSDRRKVGSVDDLIVDEAAMKVRYAVIRVDHKILDTKTDSHILLPIAGAALDPDDKRIYLEDVDTEKLLSIPAFDHRRITRGYERVVRDMFRWDQSSERAERPDFYDHPAYREGRLHQRRQTDRPLVDDDRPLVQDDRPLVKDDRPLVDDVPRKTDADPGSREAHPAPRRAGALRDDRPLKEDVRDKRSR